jgi:hypothetical protein
LDEPSQRETQGEADLRAGIHHYIADRLSDQREKYYRRKYPQHRVQEVLWHRVWFVAILATICIGLLLAGHKYRERHSGKPPNRPPIAHFVANTPPPSANATVETASTPPPSPVHTMEAAAPISKGTPPDDADHKALHHPWKGPWPWVEALIIICPFIATFAIGMGTVLDCRRRARRYPEMVRYLARIEETLRQCRANPSRLRIIEQAERMMIEEQHEWFSVTRNFTV